MNRASNGSSHFWEDRIIIAGFPTESAGFWSRIVLGIGLRILRDAGEAHELVQDVFRYLSRRSHGFQGSRSCLRSWLFQIACSHAFNRQGYLTSGRFHDHCPIDEEIGQVFSDWSPQAYEELSELRTVEVEKGKRNKILSILREFQYTAVAIPTAVRRKYHRARARFERSGLRFTKVKMHSETCKKPCGLFGD